MKIAICNDIIEFGGNRLFDPGWAQRFPGIGWVPFLAERASSFGWQIASGDIALSHVSAGYWNARDVWVIQELDSSYGKRLLDAGAKPLLLTSLESPLYAWRFFDELPSLLSRFPEIMVPNINLVSNNGAKIWPMRFPCFSAGAQSAESIAWEDRGFLALIASNKYWSTREKAPKILKIRQWSGWVRNRYRQVFSPTRRIAQAYQLHDSRLELVLFFSRLGLLDLYGRGWRSLAHLPKKWRDEFRVVNLNDGGPIDDKLDLLRQYRFSICFENVAMRGYVTEKIIESLVAKTIPIYMGAPDITNYIPEGCFINASSYQNAEALYDYLKSLSNNEARSIIETGQAFLNSNYGQLHSYEGYADWIMELAKAYDKNL